jgi:hypothetical protein
MFSLVALLSSIWTSLQHQARAQGSILGSHSQNVYLEDDIALLELLAPVAHAAASAGLKVDITRGALSHALPARSAYMYAGDPVSMFSTVRSLTMSPTCHSECCQHPP